MPTLRLNAVLGLNKTGFDAGMTAANKQVMQFANGLKNMLATGLSTAAVISWVRSLSQVTGRIKDLGEQYRITMEEVQKADFALQQSGMQFEDLGTAINKIGQNRRDAVEGNIELRKTFERYGISLRDLNDPQKRNFDLLMQLASAATKLNLTAREQVELTDLLGTKAMRLVNVLQDLANVKPNRLFTDEDIQAIDRAEKAIRELRRQAQVETAPIVAANANLLVAGIKAARDLLTGRRQEGSNVPGFRENKGGAANLFGRLLGERMTQLMLADPAKQAIGDAVGGVLQKIFGPKAAPGPLFDVDKDKKPEKLENAARAVRSVFAENPLGSIGAFTGGNTQNSNGAQALQSLKRIESALIQKGIIVRDTR